MMKIGIIGVGNIGCTLAAFWRGSGHIVNLGFRNKQRMMEYKEKNSQYNIMSYEESVKNSDILLLSVRYQYLEDVLYRIQSLIQNKIVIDCSNPFVPDKNGEDGLGKSIRAIPENETAGELLARKFSGITVIKAFCNLSKDDLLKYHKHNPPIIIPYALNDTTKFLTIDQLITDSGFKPFYLGDISQSKRIELFGDLSIHPLTEKELFQKITGLPGS